MRVNLLELYKKDGNIEVLKEKAVNYDGEIAMNNPEAIDKFLRSDFVKANMLINEHVWLLCFSNTGKLVGFFDVGKGSGSACIMEVKDIFMRALSVNAVTIVIAHNHPSSDEKAKPSADDIVITERIKEAGKLLGINLVDHIIVADKDFYSFCRSGIL